MKQKLRPPAKVIETSALERLVREGRAEKIESKEYPIYHVIAGDVRHIYACEIHGFDLARYKKSKNGQ